MSKTLTLLPLKYDWQLGENVKDDMDANLRLLGAVVQLAVASRTSDEPGTPTDGQRFIHNGGTWSVGNAGDVIARIAGAWYAFTPADGWLAKCLDEERWIEYQESGGAWVGFAEVLHNDDATSDPTATDDTDAGYSAGSRWYNASSGELFRCVDATAGAAEWLKTTLTLDELGSAATADKTGSDANVVSGTAAPAGNLFQCNADGDAVDSGVASAAVLQGSDLAANGGDVLQSDQQLQGVGRFRFGEPDDFWQSGSDKYFLYEADDNILGFWGHNGAFTASLLYGGYRNDSGNWTATRSGAAGIDLSEGIVKFRADTSKSTGSSQNPTERMRIEQGGSRFGSPSGGIQGTGTAAAEGFYDDGTLLTDYVFDAEIDGQVDTAKWDAAVPNRERVIHDDEPEREVEEPVTQTATTVEEQWDETRGAYVRRPVQREVPVYDEYPVLDEDGDELGTRRVQRTRKKTVPAKERKVEIEERTHEPAREFALDELDPTAFAAKWQADRKLPALRRLQKRSELAGRSKSGLGETIQSLIETCEVQAVHIEKLRQRIDALENGQ